MNQTDEFCFIPDFRAYARGETEFFRERPGIPAAFHMLSARLCIRLMQ